MARSTHSSSRQAPVVLLNMPGADVTRPSLALGILQAQLGAVGVEVVTIGGNLRWMERIGPALHQELLDTAPHDMLVEWVFTGAAFPDHPVDVDAFVDLVRHRDAGLGRRDRTKLRDALSWLRDDAVPFVADLAQEIAALRPTAVGCTSMFQQHLSSLAVLRAVKALDAGITTLMGGANCESSMGRVTHLRCGWVDYVVSGEADEVIVPLWELIRVHGAAPPVDHIPGGVFGPPHRPNRYPVDGASGKAPRLVVRSMDAVPTPDFFDYFAELATSPVGRLVVAAVPFETSRGCWWGAKHHCTFCGLNGNGMDFRARTAERSIAEIRTLEARHGIPRLEAVDNILAMPFLETMLPVLAADGVQRTMIFETKANLRTDQVQTLARSGVRWIQPGIESLDTRLLQLMRKGTTAAQNVLLLRDCGQHGVSVAWSSILGFPGEDDAWHAETAALLPALHHLPSGGVGGLRFDRFSPYLEQPERWELDLVPAAPYRHVYPFPAEDLSDLAYYFDRRPAPELHGDLRHRELEAPGAGALRQAIVAWGEAYRRGARLSGTWDGPVFRVMDSRTSADGVETTATACEAALLRACEPGPRTDRALREVRALGFDDTETRGAFEVLLERRWLVALDERLITLVQREPVVAPLPEIAFPGGSLLRPELFEA